MRTATLAFVALIAVSASAITFDEMASMRRIGAPQLSPDGRWIAYDGSNIDMPGNYRKSAIYLVPSTGGPSRQISDGVRQDDTPAWSPDGKTIAYVSNREGGEKHVYLYDVASGTTRKLTNYHGGASSVKWTPVGRGVVFASNVYPECGVDPSCSEDKIAAASKAPTKARVIDSLFYRHWNAWVEPTRAHHLSPARWHSARPHSGSFRRTSLLRGRRRRVRCLA